MEILNLQQIVWQAINFLILYFVIAKFVVPPTKKFLAQREQEIQDGIHNAELVKKQLQEAEQAKEEVLSAARSEGKALLEEMRIKSEELSKTMMAQAREEAQLEVKRLVSKAESELELKRKDIDSQVLKLAKVVAQKALSDSMNSEIQHSVLQKQLEQVKKIQPSVLH